jgi:hypothetical protein
MVVEGVARATLGKIPHPRGLCDSGSNIALISNDSPSTDGQARKTVRCSTVVKNRPLPSLADTVAKVFLRHSIQIFRAVRPAIE